jgi:hypothetical protein
VGREIEDGEFENEAKWHRCKLLSDNDLALVLCKLASTIEPNSPAGWGGDAGGIHREHGRPPVWHPAGSETRAERG